MPILLTALALALTSISHAGVVAAPKLTGSFAGAGAAPAIGSTLAPAFSGSVLSSPLPLNSAFAPPPALSQNLALSPIAALAPAAPLNEAPPAAGRARTAVAESAQRHAAAGDFRADDGDAPSAETAALKASAVFDGKAFKGFVAIAPGKELYVDYVPPQAGRPTVVVLNGLTYDIRNWDRMMPELRRPGNGILRLDPMGQGRTLENHGPAKQPIDLADQSKDLAALLDRMNIRERVHLLGLSYGGGWAMSFAAAYPERVKNIILMAPFIASMPDQESMIKMAIDMTRLTFPFNPASDDELYEYFLKALVYSTYPLAESDILKHPYRLEAVYRMIQHIRKMDIPALTRLLTDQTVHLIVASKDKYVPQAILDQFWNELATRFKASRLDIKQAEHKVPESTPNFAAGWINQILAGNAEIKDGRAFKGDASKGKATSDGTTIPLPRN